MTKKNEILLARCDAGELAKAAGHVNAAIDRKATVPILASVLIEPRDGELMLRATNLDMEAGQSVPAECKAASGADQRVAVEGLTLHQIASRMKGEVSLTLSLSPFQLTLTCGRAKAVLGALPGADWSSFARDDDAVHLTLASGLLASALKATAHCQSTEQTRIYLNGTHIEDAGAELVFTATDGHRLANLRTSIGGAEREGGRFEPVILTRVSAAEIGRFAAWADGPMTVSIGSRLIEVSAKGRYLAAKLLDGTFPDYQRVIPRDPDRHVTVKCKDLADAVGLVINVSAERSRSARFELHDDHLTVACRNDLHEAAAVVEYEPDAEPGEGEHVFGLNAAYVLAAIAVLDHETVTFSMSDPMSPVLLHTDDQLRQVIMPLRVI